MLVEMEPAGFEWQEMELAQRHAMERSHKSETVMSLKGKKGAGGIFAKPETGITPGVCVGIIDLGTQATNFGAKHQVMFSFEIAERMPATDEYPNPNRFVQSARMTYSFNEKATMMRMLESWRGKSYADDEDIDLETCLGRPVTLTLKESDSGYVNIDAYAPPMKGVEPLKAERQPALFSLDDATETAFYALPEWQQKVILKSPEGQKKFGNASGGWDDESPSRTHETVPAGGEFDDDIPFAPYGHGYTI